VIAEKIPAVYISSPPVTCVMNKSVDVCWYSIRYWASRIRHDIPVHGKKHRHAG
jgi:hypothetical protein